jgi:glycine cleavage system H protein
MANYKFSKEHEWARLEGDTATIGVSDYAQKELGDIVYVELPETGDELQKGDTCSNIESVKAVNDIYCPLSGEVTEVNEKLEDQPELINQDALGEGWIFKIKISDPGQMDQLMTQEEYEEYLKGISEE